MVEAFYENDGLHMVLMLIYDVLIRKNMCFTGMVSYFSR